MGPWKISLAGDRWVGVGVLGGSLEDFTTGEWVGCGRGWRWVGGESMNDFTMHL